MLSAYLEAETAIYIERFRGVRGEEGHSSVVRSGKAGPRVERFRGEHEAKYLKAVTGLLMGKADAFRFPGGALESHLYEQPDRVGVLGGEA